MAGSSSAVSQALRLRKATAQIEHFFEQGEEGLKESQRARIQSVVRLDYVEMDRNSGIKEWGKLMAAGQYGDERAYRRLHGKLRNWLTRWYRRRLPTALVEDAAQEALIAVYNNRNTYEPSRPFVPWLTSIVRYKWTDPLRAAKRRQSDPPPDDLAVGDHAGAVISELLLDRLMAALKPAQAEVVRLVELEGYSIAQTAHRTGQSHSLVKINIHRGLTKMRRTAAVTDRLPMTRPTHWKSHPAVPLAHPRSIPNTRSSDTAPLPRARIGSIRPAQLKCVARRRGKRRSR